MISNRLRARGFPLGPNMRMAALGRIVGEATKLLETDCGVDVVAQHRLSGVHAAGKPALDPFLEQCFA